MYSILYNIWWHCIPPLLILLVATFFWNPRNELYDVSIEEQKVLREHEYFDKVFISSFIKYPPIVMWTKKSKSYNPKPSMPLVCNSGNLTCEYFPNSILIPPNTTGAYLFHASKISLDDWPLPRYPNKIIWGIYHEESPKNVDILLHDIGLKLFNYSSTFSRYSDMPIPLLRAFSLAQIISTEFFVQTSLKNSLLAELSPILYIQSICRTYTDRDLYVQQLMQYQRIDSYGICLNNKKMPDEFKRIEFRKLINDKFLKFVARYKFMIAIENGVCENYISEKFWRAIHLGVVPIYFGSPSIRDWLPNEKSAILIEDYETPRHLSAYIDHLMQNDDLYEEHLEHKTKGIINNKKLKNEDNKRRIDSGTQYEFSCYLCEKLYKMNETKPYRVINKRHYDCQPSMSALTHKPNHKNIGYITFMKSKPIAQKLYHDISEQHR